MSFIVDLILIAILLICIISCFRKGFFRSVLDLATFGLSVAAAIIFGPMISPVLYEKVFYGSISGVANDAITKLIGDGVGGNINVNTLFTDKPEAFTSLLDRFNVQFPDIEAYFNKLVNENSEDITGKLSEYIASPIADVLAKVCAFILIFAVAFILLKIVAWLLDTFCRLPVLKKANQFLGLLFGILLGIFYAHLAALMIGAAFPALATIKPEIFNPAALDSTFFYKILSSFNLLSIVLTMIGLAQKV